MRKLALLLGSLVVVASASAKEVVPAPVVVEEAPVQIVEKEVIVYKEKEEGFRPNGYVDLQYRYYGDTEGQNFDNGTEKGQKEDAWNGANNYSRLQLLGKINMTENQALEFRVRDWNDLDQENARQKSETQTRLRYFYDHGNLGDSKVNFTSRVHYLHKEGSQELEYSARFNFAEYMFNNDFVKTTNFELVPFYSYSWDADNSSNYTNTIGARLKSNYDLPWGFSAEFNLYANQKFFGNGAEIEVKDKDYKAKKEDKNFEGVMEAYLYHTLPLYSNDKVSVTFNNEVGYDPYTWSQHKKFNEKTNEESNNTTYSAYYLSTVGVDYQATPNVTLYAHVGGEYRNWTIESDNSASNWRWQPTAWAGFRTTF